MRRMLLAMLASATFGGVVGGLSALAVQSQATPSAVAAAVQKVSDPAVQSRLSSILTATKQQTDAIQQQTAEIRRQGHYQYMDDNAMRKLLDEICSNTEQSSTGASCPITSLSFR